MLKKLSLIAVVLCLFALSVPAAMAYSTCEMSSFTQCSNACDDFAAAYNGVYVGSSHIHATSAHPVCNAYSTLVSCTCEFAIDNNLNQQPCMVPTMMNSIQLAYDVDSMCWNVGDLNLTCN